MQLVSYSQHCLAVTFILYHSSRARRGPSFLLLSSPRLLLTSPFLLKNSPSLPYSPPSILHCAMLCMTPPRICTCTHAYYPYRLIPSLASNVLYELAPVWDIENLNNTIRRAQRKERFVLGARGGHVAYATECEMGYIKCPRRRLAQEEQKDTTTLLCASNQVVVQSYR